MICFINIAVLIVFQNLSRDMHWKLALATNVMMLTVGLLHNRHAMYLSLLK